MYCGISKMMDKIFSLFFYAQTNRPGNGIGLSLFKAIIKASMEQN